MEQVLMNCAWRVLNKRIKKNGRSVGLQQSLGMSLATVVSEEEHETNFGASEL